MATYTVRDGNGTTISEVAPNSLLRFLNECTTYAELTRDDWPGRSVLARPDGQQWRVEIADETRRLAATTPNVDATLDVMRAWAESDDWWAEAFTWRPVD